MSTRPARALIVAVCTAAALGAAAVATAVPASAAATVTGTDDAYSAPFGADRTVRVAAPGVLGNDTTDSGLPLSATLTSFPSNGQVTLSADGGLTYAPASGYAGTDRFTYTASDGQGTSLPVTVTITVGAQGPVAVDDSYTTGYDTALSVSAGDGILANDIDSEGTGIFLAGTDTGDVDGSITVQGDGSISYTPGLGFTGVATFTYNLIDGVGQPSNTGTVRIRVLGADTFADSYTTTAAAPPLLVAAPGVLGNDVGTGTLSATLLARPAHGRVQFTADGAFTYRPTAGYVGPDSFTYAATDDVASSRSETVRLTVAPATADLAVAVTAPRRRTAGTSFTLSVTVVNHGPSVVTTTVGVALPAGLTATAAPGGAIDKRGRTVTYTIVRLGGEQPRTFAVTVAVAADVTGTRVMTASVGAAGVVESDSSDNSVRRTVTVGTA